MKKRALKSPSIDWIILQGLSFPYQTMPTWNAIGLDFVKKPSMPHPAKSLIYIYIYIYIKCCSSSSRRSIKSPSDSIRYNCQKVFSWSRRLETKLEVRKEIIFLEVINNIIIYYFFSKILLATDRSLTGWYSLVVKQKK